MTHSHTLARLSARTILIVLAVATGVAFNAPPAAAHASLIDSNPEDSATLAEPPVEITLEFSEPVQSDFVQIAVLDSDDSHHENGAPTVAGSTVTQSVAGLAAGAYRISFRVGSSDGHAVTGVLTFTVAAPADEDAEPPQPSSPTQPIQPQDLPSEPALEQLVSPTPTEQPTPAADDEPASALRWLVAGAAAAAAAALLLALLRRPGARHSRAESDTGRQ